MLGYPSPRRLEGQSLDELTTDYRRRRFWDLVRQHGGGTEFEALWTSRTGEALVLHEVVKATRTRAGLRCYESVVENVTGRARQQAAQEGEEHYRAYMESAPEPWIQFDARGRVLRANRVCQRLLGYPAQALALLSLPQLIHPEDFPHCWALFDGMIRGERDGFTTEAQHRRKVGSFIRVSCDVSLVRDAAGNPLFANTRMEDVTHRRLAEDARSQLTSLVESTDDAIVSAAREGLITRWNPAAERVYGLPAKEAVGRPLEMLLNQEGGRGFRGHFQKALEGRAVHFDTERSGPNGSRRVVSVTLSPIRDEMGAVVGVSAIARDITERKRAEEELRVSEERFRQRSVELEAANRELESFSYSVSHDLRTPLRTIEGYGKLLLDDHASRIDAEGRRLLTRIRGATHSMARLIEDLLVLSQTTRAELRREDVDLTALARRTAARLREREPKRRVRFVIADGVRANGDAHLLQVLLENLLGNAWKFTSKHRTACIEFGTGKSKGSTFFFVRDDGAGFEMARAHKLFEPFQRLHPTTEFEGSGIGLTIVQRVVQRHGGRLWARGRAEKGATFYFTL